MQSTCHVAIIMDGNGRWASQRSRARVVGHRAGAGAVRRIVESAPSFGITTLTLYAFSSDNWERPITETSALMKLFGTYLRRETAELVEQSVKLSIIGRRDRLPPELLRQLAGAEHATRQGTRLDLRIAIDYSARDAIVETARKLRGTPGAPVDRDRFRYLLAESMNASGAPDVDLLIRTGGEQRLSDFMLWEAAYAELMFSPKMWPDWTGADLAAAVSDFRMRERRFGRLPQQEKSA